MERSELIEWIIIILCIVLFWPILFGAPPEWYRVAYYCFALGAGVIIAIRRYRRMREGLRYSEEASKNLPPGAPPR